MTNAQPTGSKQRKSRAPGAKKPVVEVNERQIATGTLSTTGDAGADFIAKLSDWIQANGKVVLLILVALVGVFVYFLISARTTQAEENEFHARMQAMTASIPKDAEAKDVIKAFDAFETEALEADKQYQAEFYHRYATSLGQVLASKLAKFEKIEDSELKRFEGVAKSYADVADADPAKDVRSSQVNLAKSKIADASSFIKKAGAMGFDESEYKRDITVVVEDKPEVEFVGVTSRGDFKFKLYDTTPLANTVNMAVTASERGYYQNMPPSAVKGPGLGSQEDHLFKGASMLAIGKQLRIAPAPKEEDLAKLSEKEKKQREKKTRSDAWFSIAPETYLAEGFGHARGKVFHYYDPSAPARRAAALGFDFTDNAQFNYIYQVIGEVTEGLNVLESLTMSDQIYNIYVTRKQGKDGKARDYTPRVTFLEGKFISPLPVLWTKEFGKPGDPPRMTKPEKAAIVGSTENPRVVISTKKGDVLVELDEDMAPNTVKNFITIAESGTWKESGFHRVEGVTEAPDTESLRIVQGGRRAANLKKNKELKDKAKDLREQAKKASFSESKRMEEEATKADKEADELLEKWDWKIKNEAKDNPAYRLRNVTGTIAMARQGDLDSAGCQFFVNLKDLPEWDKEASPYCVFGRVLENLWLLYDIRKDDDILDVWVVQKRDHDYTPEVKYEGETTFRKADAIKK